jgi:hypothetical protein
MTIEYLAGIVDGEGHIYRPTGRNGQGRAYKQSRLLVVNTHKPLIDALKEQFGGLISPMKPGLGTKQRYRWQIQGKACEELARQLRPFSSSSHSK